MVDSRGARMLAVSAVLLFDDGNVVGTVVIAARRGGSNLAGDGEDGDGLVDDLIDLGRANDDRHHCGRLGGIDMCDGGQSERNRIVFVDPELSDRGGRIGNCLDHWYQFSGDQVDVCGCR